MIDPSLDIYTFKFLDGLKQASTLPLFITWSILLTNIVGISGTHTHIQLSSAYLTVERYEDFQNSLTFFTIASSTKIIQEPKA
jgi:hypothetical protein